MVFMRCPGRTLAEIFLSIDGISNDLFETLHIFWTWFLSQKHASRNIQSLGNADHGGAGNAFVQSEAFDLTDVSRADMGLFSQLSLRQMLQNAELVNVVGNGLIHSFGSRIHKFTPLHYHIFVNF